ncbi:tastin isoform X4 [Erythrolamprus reginae]|uniref:tastin isoform X4 n=1 Tax=Erythrolamprus reginae TaxID=121349 RepID=UPI00396C4C43
MAAAGKENQQVLLPFPKTSDKPGWKESILLAAGTLSSSKIPCLSKSRQPPEGRQCQPQPSSSKGRTCKLAHSNPPSELAKTPNREPFSNMQLTTSSCKNKEVSSVEFVPDPEALASILSNTGLTHQMVNVVHKHSLARRVPLKGKRTCLIGTGVEMAKANQPTGTMEERESSASSLEAKQPSNVAGSKLSTQKSSVVKKEIAGTTGEEEEFTPDPAAKASILLNIGLSHSAFGASGKVSLAQRVPLKDARKLSTRCDNMQGEGPSLSQPRTSVMSAGKYGRVSCSVTPGLKGLEKSETSGAQRTNTPFGRCSNAELSPYGLARRVPITNTQSLRRTTWTRHRIPRTACTTDKRVKVLDRVTGQMGAIGSKEEDEPEPWGKIAVRLFDEDTAASVKKVPAAPVINPEMGKLQRIEYLAKLLQQEMDGVIDYEEAPSLKKLHKRLTVHSLPPPVSEPEPEPSSTPPGDPKPSLCEQAAGLNSGSVTPAPCSTHATSSQLHACPSPPQKEIVCPSFSTTSAGLAKQRLDHLRTAPLRFHEACLNDECAFYTSRLASLAQPSALRCQEPVAKMLNAHDTMHFTPILASAPLSPSSEEERTPLS